MSQISMVHNTPSLRISKLDFMFSIINLIIVFQDTMKHINLSIKKQSNYF